MHADVSFRLAAPVFQGAGTLPRGSTDGNAVLVLEVVPGPGADGGEGFSLRHARALELVRRPRRSSGARGASRALLSPGDVQTPRHRVVETVHQRPTIRRGRRPGPIVAVVLVESSAEAAVVVVEADVREGGLARAPVRHQRHHAVLAGGDVDLDRAVVLPGVRVRVRREDAEIRRGVDSGLANRASRVRADARAAAAGCLAVHGTARTLGTTRDAGRAVARAQSGGGGGAD